MLRHFFALCLMLALALPFALPLCAQTLDREFAQAQHAWKSRDYRGAETHFERALKLAGDDERAQAGALYGRGAMRLEQHKWQGAADDLTRCLSIDPDNADAHVARGMARKGLGNYTGLLADAHEAARLDPEWKGFEDDAQSTVNWRRAMLGFLVLAGILACVGAVPLVKSLVRVSQMERAGRAAK